MATSPAVWRSAGQRPTAALGDMARVQLRWPRSGSLSAGRRATPGRSWAWATPNAAFLGLDYRLGGLRSAGPGALGPSDTSRVSRSLGCDRSTEVTAGAGEGRPTSVCPWPGPPVGLDPPVTCLAVPGTGLGPCDPSPGTQGHLCSLQADQWGRAQGLSAKAAARDSKKPQTTGKLGGLPGAPGQGGAAVPGLVQEPCIVPVL